MKNLPGLRAASFIFVLLFLLLLFFYVCWFKDNTLMPQRHILVLIG